MVTSGAVTKRVDRLERVGLLVREPDPRDRRGVLVKLTSEGLELINQAVESNSTSKTRSASSPRSPTGNASSSRGCYASWASQYARPTRLELQHPCRLLIASPTSSASALSLASKVA
ncbi:MAG: MarR family transcriptional regulator [Solirubrobacteraceae bacterium]